MGVAYFFQWLKNRYPLILSTVIESEDDGDPTQPNRNTLGDKEFDCLYLDMNGMIHPCFHPENGEAPESFPEVFHNVELYIDRVFNLIRPRKILYLAVDGVAPHSKIKQQRVRRFRAAKDAEFKRYDQARQPGMSEQEIDEIYNIENIKKHDSNIISPGTDFMVLLSDFLKDMIKRKRDESAAWNDITVILSDASVPGEGEHKIMEFIRSQRLEYGYDATRRHCVYGLDADFLFLGLSCHELYFTVLREEVFDTSGAKPPGGRFGPARFLFANGWVFRQYLEKDMKPPGLKFDWDFERALDDIIFLCVAAGNDFLPAIPGVSVHAGAIQTLIEKYKYMLPQLGGYLTDNNKVNPVRVAKLLYSLARTLEEVGVNDIENPDETCRKTSDCVNRTTLGDYTRDKRIKRHDIVVPILAKGRPRGDEKDRYYKEKFGLDKDLDKDKILIIIQEYIRGMAWTLQYYLHGCPSWSWCYPYLYAPLLSDFNLVVDDFDATTFELGAPISPLEQLMSVLPPQSSYLLPPQMGELMSTKLAEYYPRTFEVDMLGEHKTWKGVPKIPFLDTKVLLDTLKEADIKLTPMEERQNTVGHDLAYFNIPEDVESDAKEFSIDGPNIWADFTKNDDGSFTMSIHKVEPDRHLSFIPLNVERPKNIIVAQMVVNQRAVEMPLSIPGIPFKCKPDFRQAKIIEIETRKRNAQTLNTKRRKVPSFL